MKTQCTQQGFSIVMSALTLSIALTVCQSHAFVPEDLDRLIKEKNCPGCDLRSANLSKRNLDDVKLEGANLMGANLEGASLRDAMLDDASMEKVNLKGADLYGASLDNAGLEGAVLTGTILEDAVWINGKPCKKGSIGSCKQ